MEAKKKVINREMLQVSNMMAMDTAVILATFSAGPPGSHPDSTQENGHPLPVPNNF